MSPNPQILVFRMREVIYTLLLIFFSVVLILCLFLMFSGRTAPERQDTSSLSTDSTAQDSSLPSSQSQNITSGQTVSDLPASSASVTNENSFTPGIYTVPLHLTNAALEVEVTVDADHINSIRLLNLSKSTEDLYPLMSDSLDHVATQILQSQSLEGITSPQENRYTSQMLLNAVSDALELARP